MSLNPLKIQQSQKVWLTLTLAVALLVNSVVQAEQITYTGTGTFDQFIGSDVVGLRWGATFSSSFSADTGSDTKPLDPIRGFYAPILRVKLDVPTLNLHIDTVPPPVGSIYVANSNHGYDDFSPNTEFHNLPNVGGHLGIYWVFQDKSDQALTSKQLPLSLSLEAFNVRRFELDLSGTTFCSGVYFNSNCHVDGTFTTLSVVAVPEPETYAMMFAGLGLLGFVARRRRGVALAAAATLF